LQVSSTRLDGLTRWVGGSACAKASHTVWSQTSDTLETGLGNSGASPHQLHRTQITRLAPGPCTPPGRVCPKPAPESVPRV
jgi:hypothetical protein